MQILTVDFATKNGFFNHCWQKVVGSGHAYLVLRADYLEQLRDVHQNLGMEYVRFHGILNDDVGVFSLDEKGNPQYNWQNVDAIYDAILDIGMKPFVELSFMPEALASGSRTVFAYKGNICPPRNYNLWYQLIYEFTSHLVWRYSIDEVRSWYFEVWNEPNLTDIFWAGTREDYFTLYDYAAKAIKDVDSTLRVGGPATARAAWAGEMIDHCRSRNYAAGEASSPLDFISTHIYPTDEALILDKGKHITYKGSDLLRKSVETVNKEVSSRAECTENRLPIHFTEWNSSPSCWDSFHDEAYMGPFICKTIKEINHLVDTFSFWTFSDIFEEQGYPSSAFEGGFGMINLNGIHKPSYNAFKLIGMMGKEKIAYSFSSNESCVDCIVAGDGERKLHVLLYYYIDAEEAEKYDAGEIELAEEDVAVVIEGIPQGTTEAVMHHWRIDTEHGNVHKLWKEAGCPEVLSRRMCDDFKKKTEPLLLEKKDIAIDEQGKISLQLTLPPFAVTLAAFEL